MGWGVPEARRQCYNSPRNSDLSGTTRPRTKMPFLGRTLCRVPTMNAASILCCNVHISGIFSHRNSAGSEAFGEKGQKKVHIWTTTGWVLLDLYHSANMSSKVFESESTFSCPCGSFHVKRYYPPTTFSRIAQQDFKRTFGWRRLIGAVQNSPTL